MQRELNEQATLLILCTGTRSHADGSGLLPHVAGDSFEISSAESRPVGLHPNAVKAMSEIGIDIAGSRSKSLDEFTGWEFNYVLTV